MTSTIDPPVSDAPRAPRRTSLAIPPEQTVTRFEPMAVVSRYRAPGTTIHPDQTKRWYIRLAPLVRRQLPWLVTALLASGLSLIIQVNVPSVTGRAVDRALVKHLDPVSMYAWRLVVMAAVLGLAQFVFRYYLQKAAFELEYVMRVLMFQKLGAMPFSYYDTVQTGQMVSRANSDIRTIQMFLTMAPMIGMTLVTFVLAVYKMLHTNVTLTFLSLAVLPFVFGMASRMQRFLFPVSWLISSRMAEIATIVEENVGGAEVVRGFTAEAEQISIVDRAARRLRWASIRQADIRANLQPGMMNLPRVGLAVILLYGGHLVINGVMSYGDLLAFNAYVMMIQMPFMMLGMLLMMAQRSAASAARIFEVLDAEPDLVDHEGAVDLDECEGLVEFRDVTFSYNGRAASVLDGASFTLHPGETVALVGRTGIGKSTVARLIPRFYDVDGGAVLVDGHDVRDLTTASLRAHVGLVLDDSFLFSGTIRENIAFGRPDAAEDDIHAVARAAGAADFLAEFEDGYDTIVGERGSTLSGGQRQRIAIARTLLVNPRILILDDCTSAIDPHREHEIHGALRTLMAGRTTLVIAHRPATISLANRVLVIDEGRVVADGTHEELLQTSPLYQEILSHADELDAPKPEPEADEVVATNGNGHKVVVPPVLTGPPPEFEVPDAGGPGVFGGGPLR